MANTNPQPNLPVGAWGQLRTQMSRGIRPYILISAYALIVTTLLFQNPATSRNTDILFVLFLGIMLLIYKVSLAPSFKLVLALLFLGVALPYFGTLNPFYMDIATQVGIFVVLALGLNVVVGFAGLLDLGYIAFYAVGAYLWAIFSTNQAQNIFPALAHLFPVSSAWFFVFMFLALIVGAGMGLLLGLPVLRLRGDYLAIVTLGFGEVIRVLATNLDRPINITNGAQGIRDIGRPPLFFEPWVRDMGINLSRGQLYQLYFYFLVLFVLVCMIMVVYRLSNSRIGRAWTAIREDETAAVAMGVPLVRMKLTAFAVGASFAAVMGTIFASKQLFINPPTFDLLRSINILGMVILGGMGSIPGVILGATLVTLLNLQLLPRLARELTVLEIPSQFDPTQYQRMLFGLLLVLMTIFRPEGILPEDRRRQELQGAEADVPEEIAEPPPQVTEPDVGMKS
mgnify:CR=1 FL=1